MIDVFERNIHFSRRIVIENFDTDTLYGNINIRCIKNEPSSVFIKVKPFIFCKFDEKLNNGIEVSLEEGVPSIVTMTKVIKKYHKFSEYNTLEVLITELNKICRELDKECKRVINKGASDKITYSGLDIANVHEGDNKSRCPVRLEIQIKITPDYDSEYGFINGEAIVSVVQLDNNTLNSKQKIVDFSTGDIHFDFNNMITIIMGNLRKIRVVNNTFDEDEIKQLVEKHMIFPIDYVKRSFLFK